MPSPESYSLLIVDDNEMNRDILVRHLRRQGYRQIEMAENGQIALDMIEEGAFDLVLLDVMMPEINGYEVLQRLKSSDKNCHVPVIMVSAVNETDSVVRCIELGAEDYLTKPPDPVILKARVSVCLERKRLRDQEILYRQQLEEANRKLAELSQRDGLTDVANRRYMEELLLREWSASSRQQEMFSILLLDIDYFKEYNDQFGHLAGDDCLRLVSKTAAQSVLRARDVVARYGGEEFALILPDTDSRGALAIADRLQTDLADIKIPHPASKVCTYVTISIGIATTVAKPALSPYDLVDQADRAMYQAKHTGRNRIKAVELAT